MKTRNVLSAVALTAGILLGSGAVQAQYQQGPPPPPPGSYGQGGYGQGAYGQGQNGGWDAPPQDFADEFRRQGFRDGIYGAQKDFENHRRPTPNNRDEFRRPNVPRPARRAYKEGFRRGYDVGVRHIMGGGPGGPRY